jgi:hypothetical protein
LPSITEPAYSTAWPPTAKRACKTSSTGAAAHIAGDEKGEAQIFLDRLLQAFYQKGLLEIGKAGFRIRKAKQDGGGTAFADFVWKPLVLIEMKKRAANPSRAPASRPNSPIRNPSSPTTASGPPCKIEYTDCEIDALVFGLYGLLRSLR